MIRFCTSSLSSFVLAFKISSCKFSRQALIIDLYCLLKLSRSSWGLNDLLKTAACRFKNVPLDSLTSFRKTGRWRLTSCRRWNTETSEEGKCWLGLSWAPECFLSYAKIPKSLQGFQATDMPALAHSLLGIIWNDLC